MQKKEKVSWEEFDRLLGVLTEKVKNYNSRTSKQEITALYGIPRGGLLVAVCLSHRLNLPLVGAPSMNTLIVDEICDTGQTLIGRMASGHLVAVLDYKQKKSKVRPDFYARIIGDAWQVYPWEKED